MVEPTPDDHSKRFWELESIGIREDESPVYDNFLRKIKFDGERYKNSERSAMHPPLPDYYDLCKKRLRALFKRLRQTPHLLREYNSIIPDQLKKDIVEKKR